MVLSAVRGPKLNKYACGMQPIPYTVNIIGITTENIDRNTLIR